MARGLAILPDLSTVGAVILASPDDFPSHPLDMTPKNICEGCTISVRQLLFLLQQCGFVGTSGTHDRCMSYAAAVSALRRACFPSAKASFMVCPPLFPVISEFL